MTNNRETWDVRVWRGGAEGGFQSYSVPALASQTVLDVVTFIQRELDPTLSYRFACRVGMCGSCAMTINGAPRWTCRTHMDRVTGDGTLEIAPLRSLPIVKDLVVDLQPFFDKWMAAGGRFVATKTREDPPAAIAPNSKKRQNADAGIECINCAVCYAACEVVALNHDYFGPAAFNRAWTLVNDERDGGNRARLDIAGGPGGCVNCHSQQGCATYCPNGLNPTASISGLKRASVAAMLGFGGRP